MLCAAIDIGSNTTRVLVAEPEEGQLRKVMEQRAYTRIGKDVTRGDGEISDEKLEEVIDVVVTQVRLAQELGAQQIRIVATAAIREASNSEAIARQISEACGIPVDVLTDHEEGRLSFLGATKALGHPVEGEIAVVDVGGGSSEVSMGTIAEGVREVHSYPIGSGVLAEELIESDPPGPVEIRKLRERIEDFFDDVELDHPDQAVAVGGSATSLRTARRRGARVRDARARRPGPDQRPGRRCRQALRARSPPRRGARLRRPAARAVLADARPAAADRQGRASRGRDPGDAQRRRPPTAPP